VGGWSNGAALLEALELHAEDRPEEALAVAERAIQGFECQREADTGMMLAAAEVIAFPSMYERVVAIPRTTPSDTPLDRALAEVAAGRFAEAASLFEHMGSLALAARAWHARRNRFARESTVPRSTGLGDKGFQTVLVNLERTVRIRARLGRPRRWSDPADLLRVPWSFVATALSLTSLGRLPASRAIHDRCCRKEPARRR